MLIDQLGNEVQRDPDGVLQLVQDTDDGGIFFTRASAVEPPPVAESTAVALNVPTVAVMRGPGSPVQVSGCEAGVRCKTVAQ